MTHTARHFVWQIDGARALAFVRQIETSTLLRSHVFCFIEFISWHNFFFFEYKVEGDLHAVVEQMLEQVDLATVADHCVDTFRLLAAIETKSSCFCFVWFSRNVLFSLLELCVGRRFLLVCSGGMKRRLSLAIAALGELSRIVVLFLINN